jgi:hypothetical protein
LRFAIRSRSFASFWKRGSRSSQRCVSKKWITEVLFCIAAMCRASWSPRPVEAPA